MNNRHETAVIDTCTYIDLEVIDPATLPAYPEITAITLAELHQGVAMAKDTLSRATRAERVGIALASFDPLPFDEGAATRYGTLVALTLAAKRNPRPRRIDLLIAAIASSRGLPLYTSNVDGFRGLDSMLEIVPV